MTTVHDGETRTVLRKLGILFVLYYIIQFAVAMILAAALDAWEYDGDSEKGDRYNGGLLPFWHFDCGFGEGDVALISWLTMVISQLGLLWLIFKLVKSTTHAWDYSFTLSFLHFCLSSAACRALPTNWVWWLTLLLCTAIVACASELMCYFLHDLREIEKE
mmetsp:Transcript_25251/g.50651  ORF Transcript_25251/g.50651 Transcript_25251/m.50651 type:complete len:161 (-) Transcript_25251:97-579(-)|eukprot:CAMPEP_0196721842 /NCGR_PEP_ID=MMETSP1091-20130531/4321_1 /TAXON_ID=302021 /ORGANISM="Rhodomonas sp., Strain CCMP768" /LENGTH=160 /DNA_ID=CAMNT_0042063419 /DNA_START=146 /DNA_END=628 /DNA_ORIENTATION=+